MVDIENAPDWGPTGEAVYDRTYSRTKPDGTKETWLETVTRCVDGNLALVDPRFIEDGEREELIDGIYNFRMIPAGRHLWMSGVEGRQFLFNCYVSGWTERLSDHFAFTFNQLMEGGGVGANYSAKHVNPEKYPVTHPVEVHIVCSPEHENYDDIVDYLSHKYDVNSPNVERFIVPDSREGWVEALRMVFDNAEGGHYTDAKLLESHYTNTFYREIILDLSNVRPAGRPIKTFGGTSAGPEPLAKMLHEVANLLAGSIYLYGGITGPVAMQIDHAIANCVVSGNVRRSARMSIMRWDDPEIDWFLDCKKDGGDNWSTNISVEIDDEFIRLLQPTQIFTEKALQADRVYRRIVEGMLTNGEPGIWNSSLSNRGEPNPVTATNPCGEICLEEFENCNLGHVNLSAFVDREGVVDYYGIYRAHTLMTRFLIRATFGDITYDKTREVVNRNRRIGVGHFGYAGFLAKRGIRFSDSWKAPSDRKGRVVWVDEELETMFEVVKTSADMYSHLLRIPNPVKLTTVAPTGTIAKLPGETEGIHPVYAKYFIRRIRYSMIDPDQAAAVEEFRRLGYNVVEDVYAPNTWVVEIPTKEALVAELEESGVDPNILESVDEISLEDMLEVQAMYQECYANNAVSFTVNIPEGKYSTEEVAATLLPYLSRLKGTTLMVDNSRELSPYERIDENDYNWMVNLGSSFEIAESYDEQCTSGACPVR